MGILLKEREIFWKESELLYKLKQTILTQNRQEVVEQSWASFLRTQRIPLHTAEFKIALYKKWIKELGFMTNDLNDIGTRQLHRSIPYLHSRKDAVKVLRHARKLSFFNFLNWLGKIRSSTTAKIG
jgi:hypothetical protein